MSQTVVCDTRAWPPARRARPGTAPWLPSSRRSPGLSRGRGAPSHPRAAGRRARRQGRSRTRRTPSSGFAERQPLGEATRGQRGSARSVAAGPQVLAATNAPPLPVRPGCTGRVARCSRQGRTRRPPPAGATTPAIASRSLLFEQIPSVFEQVASAALVTSSPGRGARQLARRRPCFPELQVELSGARRVAVAAAAVGEGSGGNRRRDSACVPRCATTSRCRRPRTPGVVGDSDEDGATLVSG